MNKTMSFKSLIAVLAISTAVFAAAGDAYVMGDYLVKTKWAQRTPYNNQTPTIDGQHTVTGCTPTAMAQIMNYYKWPPRAIDTIPAYITATHEISIPALHPFDFDWDNMTDTYGNTSTEEQRDAVAALMSAAGKAAVANYKLDGTSSNQNKALRALVRYFDYDYRGIKYLARNDGYSASEWEQIMKDQIDKGLPVLYAGKDSEATGDDDEDNSINSHAYILDGYDNSGNFHVNWGWGGSGGIADGFYAITVNGSADANFKYRYNQRAVINQTRRPFARKSFAESSHKRRKVHIGS